MPDQEPRTVANMPCPLPPEGWYCTRPAGHDGPCAAIEYPQEPRTGGVALWRYEAIGGYRYHEPSDSAVSDDYWEPGTWFPLAEAEALLGKARDRDEWKASRELQKACADALRAQAESLIDPTDPAVRERVTEAMRDRFNADGVYVLPGDIDAVLAALRGAK